MCTCIHGRHDMEIRNPTTNAEMTAGKEKFTGAKYSNDYPRLYWRECLSFLIHFDFLSGAKPAPSLVDASPWRCSP